MNTHSHVHICTHINMYTDTHEQTQKDIKGVCTERGPREGTSRSRSETPEEPNLTPSLLASRFQNKEKK